MMDEHQAVIMFKTCIYLVGTWCFLMLHGKTRREQFRYEMQWLGEDLDQEASAESTEPNHAYGLLRKTVNGFIRSGDALTPLYVLFAVLFGRKRGQHFAKKWEDAKQGLTPAARVRLESFRGEINRRVVSHIFLRSPVFMATIILPLLNWLKDGWVREWLIRKLRCPLNKLALDALAQGERRVYLQGGQRNQAREHRSVSG